MTNQQQFTPLDEPQRSIDIYFRSNGFIDISVSTAKALDLQVGDVINIVRSEHEVYLYVAHRAVKFFRYPHKVYRPNKTRGSFRCFNRDITAAINFLTASPESWLFVGEPLQVDGLGTCLPLITSNNQYPKRYENRSH